MSRIVVVTLVVEDDCDIFALADHLNEETDLGSLGEAIVYASPGEYVADCLEDWS